MDLDEVLAATFSLIAPHLTERQHRLLLAQRPEHWAAAVSAGSRGRPRRPDRRSAVVPPSWIGQPIPEDASAGTMAQSGGATPIRACWRRWTGRYAGTRDSTNRTYAVARRCAGHALRGTGGGSA